jgi:hypothetical protein
VVFVITYETGIAASVEELASQVKFPCPENGRVGKRPMRATGPLPAPTLTVS